MSHTSAIGSSQVLQSLLGQSDRVAGSKKETTTEGTAPSRRNDSASFSTTANLVQASSATDDVRTAKVTAIQSAIAAGTYSVPASAVADKLIEHLLG